MKKRFLSVFMCVAMVATMLVGCGSSSAPAAEAPAEEAPAAEAEAPAEEAAPAAEGGFHFEIVSKGEQHQYWQAVKKGAQEKADELGDTMTFVGPASESETEAQVQMFENAINQNPDAIGLAALSTEALIDGITRAMEAGIPIVGFDSGVPGAPEGAILANAATNNYNAGVLAAEKAFELIEDKLADGAVIGVLSQDATSESVCNRGLGFIDKMAELIIGKGLTVDVIGNDKFVNETKATKTAGGNVTIEVKVPTEVKDALSEQDCVSLLNKPGIICVYGSNEHSAKAIVSANPLAGNKVGTEVVGVGFDSGEVQKDAIKSGVLSGSITQAPFAMGAETVRLLHEAAMGQAISDVDTGCQWYTAENIDNPEISVNLYD